MKSKILVEIRPAELMDGDSVWAIMEPIIRAGETYSLPRNMTREEALTYWFSIEHEVFVAVLDGEIVGTYFLTANHAGGGSHVANAGFMTAHSSGGKGIASSMLTHSLGRAKEKKFRAMQFNFVVSSNTKAVQLWQKNGFEIVGTLPNAFLHPNLGFVDAYVMFQQL